MLIIKTTNGGIVWQKRNLHHKPCLMLYMMYAFNPYSYLPRAFSNLSSKTKMAMDYTHISTAY
jgi:hypothetical protein